MSPRVKDNLLESTIFMETFVSTGYTQSDQRLCDSVLNLNLLHAETPIFCSMVDVFLAASGRTLVSL